MTTTSVTGAVAPTPKAAPVATTETPGEYAGEAESRGSLPFQILDRLVTPRTDCLIWTGATDRGYGRISINGETRRVHRIVWEAAHGPIPDDLTIDHLCRVKSCCNVAHMELVTGAENARRAVPYRPRRVSRMGQGQGQGRTHCDKGHELTEDNVYIHPSRPNLRRCRICRANAPSRLRRLRRSR